MPSKICGMVNVELLKKMFQLLVHIAALWQCAGIYRVIVGIINRYPVFLHPGIGFKHHAVCAFIQLELVDQKAILWIGPKLRFNLRAVWQHDPHFRGLFLFLGRRYFRFDCLPILTGNAE